MQDINPQLVSRLSQRLFFVVNKIDLTRTSEGLEPDEIKHYVANLVTSQLATEGFQLSPDQVNCRAFQRLPTCVLDQRDMKCETDAFPDSFSWHCCDEPK